MARTLARLLPTLLLAACSGTVALTDAAAPDGPPPLPGDGAGVADGSVASHAVYVNTADALYRFDPKTAELTRVGAFDCMAGVDPSATDGMLDLAIDEDERLVGVGAHYWRGGSPALFDIDPQTARCTQRVALTGADDVVGISFVPKGTLSPTEEALAGVTTSCEYARIDPLSGVVQVIAAIASPCETKGGDLVSIAKDATYTAGSLGGGTDHLLVADPQTGRLVEDRGDLGSQGVNGGLAYWGGTLYGFGISGEIVQIDPRTAKTAVLRSAAGLSLRGAAVTTVAPVTID